MKEIQKYRETIKIQPQDSGDYSGKAGEILSSLLEQHVRTFQKRIKRLNTEPGSSCSFQNFFDQISYYVKETQFEKLS